MVIAYRARDHEIPGAWRLVHKTNFFAFLLRNQSAGDISRLLLVDQCTVDKLRLSIIGIPQMLGAGVMLNVDQQSSNTIIHFVELKSLLKILQLSKCRCIDTKMICT